MWITSKCNPLTANVKIFNFYVLHKFQSQPLEWVLNNYKNEKWDWQNLQTKIQFILPHFTKCLNFLNCVSKKEKKVLTKAFKCVILSKLPMQHKSELWQINNNATLKILKSKQHQCCGSERRFKNWEQTKNSKPDEFLVRTNEISCQSCSVCGANATHRPAVYFVELAPSIVFKNRAPAQASLAVVVFMKTAHETI